MFEKLYFFLQKIQKKMYYYILLNKGLHFAQLAK